MERSLSVLGLLLFVANTTVVVAGSGDGDSTHDEEINSRRLNPGDITQTITPWPLEQCTVPPYSNPTRVNEQENFEELSVEGRCYLACTMIDQTKVKP